MEKTGIQKASFWLIVILLIAAGIFSYGLRYLEVQPDRQADFSQIPMQAAGWQAEEIFFSESAYEILKATLSTMRAYRSQEQLAPVLFIGYFKDQKYGSQIHSPRHCLPGSGWGILTHRRTTLSLGAQRLPINYLIIGDRNNRQLMYYWFETRTGKITSEFALKFNLFLNALLLKPTDAAFIRLTINLPAGHAPREGEEILQRFLSEFYESIENSLPFNSR